MFMIVVHVLLFFHFLLIVRYVFTVFIDCLLFFHYCFVILFVNFLLFVQ